MTAPDLDAARIERAAAGDKQAIEELLRVLEPELRAAIFIPPRWRRSLDANDVLQVSFLESFLRLGTLRERTPAGLRAWMRRLVRNNLTDAIRGLERDRRPDPARRVTHGPQGGSARTLLGLVAGEALTAGARASLEEELERLRSAIERLPPSYRAVVKALDLDERPVSEVAAEMGRSAGAVHLLRARAHERLSELLRERGAD